MEGRENDITMGQLFLRFFAQVQKQGLTITLLVLATVFSFHQNAQTQGKVDACMQMRIDDANTERVQFLQIMTEVRNALQENTRERRRDRD